MKKLIFTFFIFCAPLTCLAQDKGMLNTIEFKNNSISTLPKWQSILNKWPSEQEVVEKCRLDIRTCPHATLFSWITKINSHKDQPKLKKMRILNAYINGATQADSNEKSWESPLESFNHTASPVSLSILKYFTLKLAGIPEESMRITIARDILRNKPHAFVYVKMPSKSYILDHLYNNIRPTEKVAEYIPLYSFNSQNVWTHLSQGEER